MAIRYGKLKLMKDRNPDADEEEVSLIIYHFMIGKINYISFPFH